jgi:hypoxanthine phosphoribosyltransferase
VRKQVLTVDPAELSRLANQLLETMMEDGFRPDCVVGIATGGAIVATAMQLPDNIQAHTVQLRRPSTATKDSSPFARKLANFLPYFVLDHLRRVEDRRLEHRAARDRPTSTRFNLELDKVAQTVLASARSRIAVVDDAVDSGTTLAMVAEGLRSRLDSSVEIRTAVLTVTRPDDRIALVPNHRLFDQTLLRFPWSMDYKG